MKRAVAYIMTICMLLGMVTFAMPAGAASFVTDGTVGKTFNADDITVMSDKLDTVPYTYEAWVKLPTGKFSRTTNIFSNYTQRNTAMIQFQVTKNGNPRLFWMDQYKVSYEALFEQVTVNTGNWEHLAIVHDSAAGRVYCYHNGVKYDPTYRYATTTDGTTTSVVLPSAMTYPDIDPHALDISFAVGGTHERNNSGYFKGEIASLALYSDARTETEIAADMQSVNTADTSLITYYDLTQPSVKGTYANGVSGAPSLIDGKMWLTEDEMADYRKVVFDEDFERAYSIVVVGDTQMTTQDDANNGTNNLDKLYGYIADHVDDKNIQYVIGVGDITDDDVAEQWDVAEKAIKQLDGKVGYSLVRGNHDTYKGGEEFIRRFATDPDYMSQFTGENGGCYEEGSVANTWTVAKFENNEYLILNLDWAPVDAVLDWAGDVISSHPDHKVIVMTHNYLFYDQTHGDEDDDSPATAKDIDTTIAKDRKNNGDDIWRELISQHKNIEMVFCGHVMSENIVVAQRQGKYGNTVTEALIDAQGVDATAPVGKGIVAFLYFNEDGTKYELEYYSTVLDKYYKSNNQFTVDLTKQGTPYDPETDWDGTPEQPRGSGSMRDPYLISSAGNLQWMAHHTNKNRTGSATTITKEGLTAFDGCYFKQTNDIDLGGSSIKEIGYGYTNDNGMAAFGGVYDGCGYKIKNGSVAPITGDKKFSRVYGYGLFGCIYGAEIKNVRLENVDVIGKGMVGGIVGYAEAPTGGGVPTDFNKITNCHIDSTSRILASMPVGQNANYNYYDGNYCAGMVGGIVGLAHGTTVSYCTSDVEMAMPALFGNVGGIAGGAGYNSVIDSCKFTGGITRTDTNYRQTTVSGGIVGMFTPGPNTRYFATDGSYTSNASWYGTVKVKNCYNSGYYKYTATAAPYSNTIYGGIAGGVSWMPYTEATEADPYPFLIENCHNLYAREAEAVHGTSKKMIQGGIVGKGLVTANKLIHSPAWLKDCYSVEIAVRADGHIGTNEYRMENKANTDGHYGVMVIGETVATKTANEIKVYTDAIDSRIAGYNGTTVPPVYNEPAAGTAPDFNEDYDGTFISKNAIIITDKAEFAAIGKRVVESWEGKNYTFYAGINAFETLPAAYRYCIANEVYDPDIIVVDVPEGESMEITIPSRVFAPNWDTKPYNNGDSFDATKDYDKEWTENQDYLNNQLIVKDIRIGASTTAGTVGVYGFTFTGLIRDTYRLTSPYDTHITVKNLMKDGTDGKKNDYIYMPTNANTNHAKDTGITTNFHQQDKVDIINLYIRKTHESARLIGEYTSAYTTIDGLYCDAYKSGFGPYTTYVKQAAEKSVFTIKNSRILNFINASPTANSNGFMSFSGRNGMLPLENQHTELVFDNNVIKGFSGRFGGDVTAYAILWYPAAFTDFTFTDNYFEMPRNEAATKQANKDTSAFFYSSSITESNCDLDSMNDITITDNMFVGVSTSFSVGANNTVFTDFNFVVKDNYLVSNWVDDFTNTVGDAVSVNSKHKRGGGKTVYYLDSAMTKKSNVIYDYTFGDNYVSDSDKKTLKPAGASPVSYVENEGVYTYTADLTDIIKTSTYNTYTVGYGDTTVGVSENLVYRSDKLLDCDTPITLTVKSHDGTVTETWSFIPAQHSFTTKASNSQATPADCDNAATYFVQCDNCDAVHTTMTVVVGEKNGHAFNQKDSGQKAEDATCKAPQKNYVQCDNCSAVSTDKTISVGDVVDHKYENYVSDNNATCQKNCTETGTCIWCEAPDTRDIADSKVDHKYESYVSDNNATCQKNCTETAKCKWCDEKDTRDIADSKVDHKFETYVSDNNATCCNDGTKTAKCKWCDEKDTVADANTAKGHGDTTKVFKDVAAGKWYVNAINYNYTHKFISGMKADEFGVNTEVTRGMFITILARIAGVDTSDNNVKTKFTDVESGKYFTAAIKWASENKIVNGMTATTFAPNAPIQRQQLCVMIVNFAKHQKIELTASEKAISFKDAAAIGNYAKEAVATCQMADIVNGYANGDGFDFKPTNTATRAEAAQILYKFHKDFVA